jgi:hypothetical protein
VNDDMPIFKKKKASLEDELASLRQRAEALEAKRQTADAELSVATEARQQHLVEGDLSDVKAAQMLQDRVNVAASMIVGLEDAVAVVSAQIADIEQKLDAERTQAERKAASDQLARDLDEMDAVLPDFLATTRRFIDAFGKVGHWHYESGELGRFVSNCVSQTEIASAFSLQELRGIVEQIKTGSSPIPPKPEQPASAVAVQPAPPTMTVFLLRSVRFTNHVGKKVYATGLDDCEMPTEAAQRALRYGAAVHLSNPRRAELKGAKGGTHGDANALNVTDLDEISDASGARYIGPDNNNDPVAQANITPVDRGPARTIAIPAGRAG